MMTSNERFKLCQSLIGLILKNKNNLLECFKHNLQQEWLETGNSDESDNLSMATIYSTIVEFFKVHKAIPTRKILVMELKPSRGQQRQIFRNIIDQCKKQAKKDSMEMIAPYIEKISEFYRKAMTMDILRETVEKDSDSEFKSAGELSDFLIGKLVMVQQNQNSMNKVILSYDSMQRTIVNLKKRPHPPIPTGWHELDEHLEGGWFPGTITTIAGRPGMGKTIFLLNSAISAAKLGTPTLFIGAELSEDELNYRQFSSMSDTTSYGKMFRGYNPKDPKCIGKREMREIETVSQLFKDMPLYVVSAMGMDISTVMNLIIEQVMIRGIKTVFLDYFQRMCIKGKNGTGSRRANSTHEFTDISNKILNTVIYTNIAYVQGSQLNRECEKRKGDDRRPRISDLKDSGCIEEDSNRVIGLYRDEFYNPAESQRPGEIDVQCLKNRSGNNAIVSLHFNGVKGLISSIARGGKR